MSVILGKSTLHNADCMDLLRQMPDKAYDLAIVDPPYGIGVTKMTLGNGKKKVFRGNLDWDKLPPPYAYFTELQRVSKNQIIWGANHFISRMPYDSSCWIVWDKRTDGNDFADCELAWTSFHSAVRIFRFRWQGMLQENMKNKEARIHPTQKPVALYKWLLHNYAKEGDRILDTHLGSGSIAIACHDLGYELTGIELDADYYAKALQRIREHQQQLTMF